MRNVELAIDQQTYCNQVKDDRGGYEPAAKPNARQTFPAAVVFGDGLKRYAPPKIPIDLNVPLVPPAIGGIAPAFFIQQLKDGPQQIVTVPALFAPKNSATQAAREACAFGQLFVFPNHACRRAFKAQPGEIARKSAH